MPRTLLVLDDGALFADTQLDLSALDRWERAVVEEAGGWDHSAPVYRRALSSWREKLMVLLAAVRPDVIAVAGSPVYAPRLAAAKVIAALPDCPAASGLLPVADASPGALAFAVGRVDNLFERVLIVTGQRDAKWLESVSHEVAWRTGCVPRIVNAGRLGLLERDVEPFAPEHSVGRRQNRL